MYIIDIVDILIEWQRYVQNIRKYLRKIVQILLKPFFIIIFKMVNKFSCYITIIILFLLIINQYETKIDFDMWSY